MEFRTSPRNREVAAFPQKLPPPLRSDGNLNYLQVISLIRHLWEDSHPDIPLRPVQSGKYSTYPVIVYSLQNRTPFTNEPKRKYRDVQVTEDDRQYATHGQRFNNVVVFTVVTETNPELCEAIIEAFEDFMHECTGYFKRLGVSDMFYVRRLPDREQTRPDEDVDMRAVAFNIILEKVYIQKIQELQEIVVKARVVLDTMWRDGSEFWAFDGLDDNTLFVPGHVFKFGDIIQLLPPPASQDDYAEGATETIVQHNIPAGLTYNYAYQIVGVDGNYIIIQNLNGSAVQIRSSGMGVIKAVESISSIPVIIEDDFQSFAATPATPSY